MAVAQPQQQEPQYMTEAEYLEFEESSEFKHEYVNGRVYAMSGGSLRHGVITVNISTDLNIQLEDRDCKVSSPDTRIKIEAMKSFRYPDVTVYCGEEDYVDNRADILGNPLVIVEVLSPSTALTDRNEKLEEYIKIETLQEYVLVSQDEAKVEIFTRHEADKWLYSIVKGLENSFELPSIGCKLELSRIYRKVQLDRDTTSDDSNKPD
ncbi:MAG: Uma2 family endonuclease [Anaerolineaceae bacterium]|nr:Uma2 family endonuclease [Anaerolineaceae bacterium]